MKARELKELRANNPQDLKVKLNDLKAELFNLRFQLATGQLENHRSEHEVLMDHADMQGRGVIGVADLDFLAVLFDDALLRLVKAEQHAHQGGLACAVFAQQGVNFSTAELQRHIVVGLDAGEFLGDVQHFNDKIFHVVTPLIKRIGFCLPL